MSTCLWLLSENTRTELHKPQELQRMLPKSHRALPFSKRLLPSMKLSERKRESVLSICRAERLPQRMTISLLVTTVQQLRLTCIVCVAVL